MIFFREKGIVKNLVFKLRGKLIFNVLLFE